METALQIIGVFFLIDLGVLLIFLVMLTVISKRRQTKAQLRCSFGILLVTAFCLCQIYGVMWFLINAAK